eukprot:1137322-Pelagomonas_calceolata.AAC.2
MDKQSGKAENEEKMGLPLPTYMCDNLPLASMLCASRVMCGKDVMCVKGHVWQGCYVRQGSCKGLARVMCGKHVVQQGHATVLQVAMCGKHTLTRGIPGGKVAKCAGNGGVPSK